MFKSKPKSFLGIDIGSYSIRVIEIGKKGRSFELKNYGESISTPTKDKSLVSFENNSFSLSDEEIAKKIKGICEEAEIKTKNVNFTIPDFYTFFTIIDLPKMEKRELDQAIEYEVRPYIPLAINEITLDWNIIEGKVGKTPLKILVAAIPNDVISQYKEIAKSANLTINFLEPEVFSLTRTLKQEKEIIGLVDIGIKSTTCSIVEKGLLKTSHSFNVGGNEFTLALARSLKVSYNEAEEIKREKGIEDSSNREILLPLIDSIVEEIKMVLRNYYEDKGQEVKKIVLAGGLIKMPGLKEYLEEKLKKQIVSVNPFAGISYPDILKEELKKRGPFYAIATGAALKGFE